MQNFETVHRHSIRRGEIARPPAVAARPSWMSGCWRDRRKGLAGRRPRTTRIHTAGPEALSFDDVAHCFRLILGRPVSYRREPILRFLQVQVANGQSACDRESSWREFIRYSVSAGLTALPRTLGSCSGVPPRHCTTTFNDESTCGTGNPKLGERVNGLTSWTRLLTLTFLFVPYRLASASGQHLG